MHINQLDELSYFANLLFRCTLYIDAMGITLLTAVMTHIHTTTQVLLLYV